MVVNRYDLQAGGSGFLIAVPVRDNGRVVSFVVGVVSHEDFFSATLDEVVSADYQYRVLEGTRELFRRSGPAPWGDAHSARVAIPFFNVRWEAEISPLVSRAAEPHAAVGNAERYPVKP
jgi:sensor domain CHASE-containing protein